MPTVCMYASGSRTKRIVRLPVLVIAAGRSRDLHCTVRFKSGDRYGTAWPDMSRRRRLLPKNWEKE